MHSSAYFLRMVQRLQGRSVAKPFRFFFTVAGTVAMLATAWKSVQFGLFTVTLDLLIKLVITFAYTHGLSGTRRGTLWPSASKPDPLVEACHLLEPDSPSENGFPSCEEKSSPVSVAPAIPRITACAVGWREDAELYRRCLQCFATDPICGPIVAGVDGDTPADQEMVDIFMETFPDAHVIRLPETLAATMEQYMLSAQLSDVEDAPTCEFIMEHLTSKIRALINEQTSFAAIRDARGLCVVQPHQSKKDILFTTLVVAGVVSNELGLEYVFSTDSDSAIVPGGLEQVVALFDRDVNTGGVSGHLRFVHPTETYLSRMVGAHFWFEQEIAKAQGAIFGAVEIQPGPSAGFRVTALQLVLVPWYCQRMFGQKMITNEDRHLTTRLLWAGFEVHYAPGAIVYTDTPNTFRGWLKQQIRWARGTMTETLWFPWMLTRLSPLHVYNILKARSVPIMTFWAITLYALGFGKEISVRLAPLADVCCALALQVVYLACASPDRPTRPDLLWLAPSIVWFFFMTPAIYVWSLVTIFDHSWGNAPRGLEPASEKGQPAGSRFAALLLEVKQMGFQVLWIGILCVAALRACRVSSFV